jgi:hypothetical protein
VKSQIARPRPKPWLLAIATWAAACSSTSTTGGETTIVLQPGGTDGIVALVSSLTPDQAVPDYGYVGASAWTWSGEPGVQHGYLNFDFSGVPPGAEVGRATLTLTGGDSAPDSLFGESTLSGDNTAVISRVTSAWDEATLTWNTQPAITAEGAVTIGPSLSPDQVLDVDVTAQVRAMLSSGQPHGFAFQLVDEQYYRSMMFAASNQSNAATRPSLTLKLSGAGGD